MADNTTDKTKWPWVQVPTNSEPQLSEKQKRIRRLGPTIVPKDFVDPVYTKPEIPQHSPGELEIFFRKAVGVFGPIISNILYWTWFTIKWVAVGAATYLLATTIWNHFGKGDD